LETTPKLKSSKDARPEYTEEDQKESGLEDDLYSEAMYTGYSQGFDRCLDLINTAATEIGLDDHWLFLLINALENGPGKNEITRQQVCNPPVDTP
jgi:hypothetical protein